MQEQLKYPHEIKLECEKCSTYVGFIPKGNRTNYHLEDGCLQTGMSEKYDGLFATYCPKHAAEIH